MYSLLPQRLNSLASLFLDKSQLLSKESLLYQKIIETCLSGGVESMESPGSKSGSVPIGCVLLGAVD